MDMPPPPTTPRRNRGESVRPHHVGSYLSPIDLESFPSRRSSVPPGSPSTVITPSSSLGRALLRIKAEDGAEVKVKVKTEESAGCLYPHTPRHTTPARGLTPSPSSSNERRRRSPSIARTLSGKRSTNFTELLARSRQLSVSRRPSVSPSPRRYRAGTAPSSTALNRERVNKSQTPSPLRRQHQQGTPLPQHQDGITTATAIPRLTSSSVGPAPLRRGSVTPSLDLPSPPPSRQQTPDHLISRSDNREPSSTPGLVIPSMTPQQHLRNGKRIIDSVSISSSSSSSSPSPSPEGAHDEPQLVSWPTTFAASSHGDFSSIPPASKFFDPQSGEGPSHAIDLSKSGDGDGDEGKEEERPCTIHVQFELLHPDGDVIARSRLPQEAYLGPQRCSNTLQFEVLDRAAHKVCDILAKKLRKVRRGEGH